MKTIKPMKLHRVTQLVILTIAIVLGSRALAVTYIQDGFNYPEGSEMYSNTPWNSFGNTNFGNTNLCIVVWTNGLTFSTGGATLQDFSPPGLAVLETNNANESSSYWCVANEFSSIPTTSSNLVVYTSFLLNAQPHNFTGTPGAGGANNEPLNKNCDVIELTCTNNLTGRGPGGSDLQPAGGTTAWDMMYDSVSNFLGLAGCASGASSSNWINGAYVGQEETAWYSNSIIATNVTYFIVLKYTWGTNVAAGYSPNTVSMYINPTPGASEPAMPNLKQNSSGAAFGTSYHLGAIFLNTPNGNNQRTPIVIDSLRVASTWAEVTPEATASTPTTTALALSSGSNPSGYGTALAIQATVSPVPPDGEDVIFYNGVNAIGTNTTAGGVATLTTSTLTAGSDSITAYYTGDATYAVSSNSPALSQTVNQATPTLTAPTASAITSGQTLASSILSGGTATNANNNSPVAGSFAFTTPGTTPGVGTASQSVTFMPADLTDYTTALTSVNVTVNPPSQISTPVINGSNGTVNFVGQAYSQYALDTTSSLNPPITWTPVVTNTTDGGGNVSFNFSVTVGTGFYRVRSVP